MPCALNGEVIPLHTWRNMHPSTPLPQQQQLDRLARDIELAAFDEESVAIMAVIEYVTFFEYYPAYPRDKNETREILSKESFDQEGRPFSNGESGGGGIFEPLLISSYT